MFSNPGNQIFCGGAFSIVDVHLEHQHKHTYICRYAALISRPHFVVLLPHLDSLWGPFWVLSPPPCPRLPPHPPDQRLPTPTFSRQLPPEDPACTFHDSKSVTLWNKKMSKLDFNFVLLSPPCSSVPLQMVICKEDGSPDDRNQGDGGARIVANDHPDDPASSVPLQMVICKEDCPPNDQNQRDRGAGRGCCKWPPGWSSLFRAPPFLCKWSFAKRTVLRMTYIFLVGWGWNSRPAPSIEDPQYKILAYTDQRFRS